MADLNPKKMPVRIILDHPLVAHRCKKYCKRLYNSSLNITPLHIIIYDININGARNKFGHGLKVFSQKYF